ncbi:GNAT family N-acetyltransferase [Aurantivibrio infirmus]
MFKNIPEFSNYLSLEKMLSRIGEANYLSLVFLVDNQPVAFKLGYEIDNNEFYSWLGGVIPEHRARGIAKQLMFKQEAWVAENGYNKLSVKSMNKFPAMMCMLIANGYLIESIEPDNSVNESKILFSKKIGRSLNS